MVLIYLYKPLKEGDTFTNNQAKITKFASELMFQEHFNGVGEFEFIIPASDEFSAYAHESDIISIDNQYFGIIRQIKQTQQINQNSMSISGVDLKGYLSQRLTLYPATEIDKGLQGYDAIKEVSTETVTKYFVNNNLVNPTNPKRKIVGLELAPDQTRGLASDQYMSRFESLTDVCFKNLEPQKMGYKINADIKNSKLIFDVCKGVDRTAKQSVNNRIIFDVRYKNMLSFEYFTSLNEFKNIFYSSLSNARNEAQTMTCMYQREGEEEEKGALRFEQHLNVSINLPPEDIYAQLKEYALKDASNYEKIETVTALVTDKYVFAVDYNLGDFVTVQARRGVLKRTGITMDVQIKSVTHRWTKSGNVVHELGFGTGKISKFSLLERKIKNGGI